MLPTIDWNGFLAPGLNLEEQLLQLQAAKQGKEDNKGKLTCQDVEEEREEGGEGRSDQLRQLGW